MIGTIIVYALLLCGLILIIAMLYMRPSQVQLSDKAVDLSKVMPIQTITDGVIVNGNGDLTIGYRLFLPEVFTLSEETAKGIQDRIDGLLKMLPSGTILHQQCYYCVSNYENDEYSTNPLKVANLGYFDGKQTLLSYTNLYITFTASEKRSIRRNATNNSLLRKFDYPFKQPFKKFESKMEELEPCILNFENGLSAISEFSIKRMDSNELNNAVYDYLNLSYATPVDDATTKSLNPLLVTKGEDMQVGKQYLAMISLAMEGEHIYELSVPNTGKSRSYGSCIELPENIKSKCSMIYPVGLGLPFDHIVNVVIEITDTDSTIRAINSEKQSLNYVANFYPPAKDAQKEQDLFCETITEMDYQTAYTAFNVIVNDTDRFALMRKISLVQQGFSFMNRSSCYIENAELCNLFFSNIPGNARANYRGFINTTKQAICYLQKDSIYMSSLSGHLYCDRFGNPCKIDMWYYSKLNNKNKIVIGPSGSGKSFWLNNYILQSYELSHDVMIVDIGGSYRSMIELNRGKYFDSTDQSKFAFNPFLCDRDKNGKYLYKDNSDKEGAEDLIKTIAAVISYIWKQRENMTPTEAAILRKSIIEFYEYVNNSSLYGSSERIFPNLIQYRKYLPLVVIITLQMVVDKIKKRQGVKKELIIDEALDFLQDEKFGDFIAYLYRTFRKKEGAITIAAQNVLFLKNCPASIKDSITINCDTKVILDHSQYRSELPNLRDMLSLSEDQLTLIESLQNAEDDKWREFFIKMSNDTFVFRNEVSPFAAVAFDSRQATVVRIKQLFEETGSINSAINRYLEEKKK